MEMVLYDTSGGYYNSLRDPIGPGGDYDTSPEVHSIFGQMIAKQIISMFYSIGVNLPSILDGVRNKPLTFIEIGAGKGCLMKVILNEIQARDEDLFEGIRCVIIEKSPAMIARQKALLAEEGLDHKMIWHTTLDSMRADGGLTGCILSNEVVDAFPVHRVVMTEEGLKEIYVVIEEERFVEAIDDVSTPDLFNFFECAGIELDIGQEAEANLEALRWMKTIGETLQKGYVLTMDYGHTAADLYAPHRKKGSLLCYHRHMVHGNPYIHIGEQDITSHVDFTALALAGKEAGLEVSGFTDQQHFLISLGMAETMDDLDPQSPAFIAMKRLIADESMGRTFKVLIQHKGLIPPDLQGLSFKPFFEETLWR